MSKFVVTICTRGDYSAALDTMNAAFDCGIDSEWFQKNMGNCTPYPHLANEVDIARHYIAKDDNGNVIGVVGAYPFEVVMKRKDGAGAVAVNAVGIGQVCTLKQWRGRNVMRSLLSTALDNAKANGAVMGFLSGDRFRYGRFGFDFGGENLTLNFQKHRYVNLVDQSGLWTKIAAPNDIPLLNELYTTLPAFVKRDDTAWKKQFQRLKHRWIIGEADGESGYIAYGDNKGEIVEAAGDTEVVKRLLSRHMIEHNLDSVSVSLPNDKTSAMYNALWALASHYTISQTDLAAVFAPIEDNTSVNLELYHFWVSNIDNI
ncbi:MAG: GNAT family N-acetyltransferase [Clostridiales bacterium]|jgi:GNAT superfamily N-acetyltransferase|nr:GNAT family N-acetyltransferase [Clostridiales bacterium]